MIQNLAVVTPCYNEGESILIFLKSLEHNLTQLKRPVSVIVVDDCSQDDTQFQLSSFSFSSVQLNLHVLRLKFNVGHQPAIFQGLLYASEINADQVIVMDSDGEDDPKAIPLMMNFENFDIVEVRRGKRSEKITFKILYNIYKLIFRFISGKNMNYGNYCRINKSILERVIATSFIHFPAFLLKQKVSRTHLVYDRGKRIRGQSKMGMKGLLIHSFKSFIEFGEDLLMLFLKLFIVIVVVIAAFLLDILYQKLISHTAILGWTSTLVLILMNIAILCIGFFTIGILILNLIHQQNNNFQKNIYSVVRNGLK